MQITDSISKNLIDSYLESVLKKHQFFLFQNFEDSFLEIFKYHYEKKTCRLFLNIERKKTHFFRKNIMRCKLHIE